MCVRAPIANCPAMGVIQPMLYLCPWQFSEYFAHIFFAIKDLVRVCVCVCARARAPYRLNDYASWVGSEGSGLKKIAKGEEPARLPVTTVETYFYCVREGQLFHYSQRGNVCPACYFSINYPDFSPRFTLSWRSPPSRPRWTAHLPYKARCIIRQ